MLLQRLSAYVDRTDLPEAVRAPRLYAEAPVRYIVDLDRTGRLLNREPSDTAESTNARTMRGQRRLVPQIQRSSGIKPLLLVGNAEYTFGLAREEAKSARARACHEAYVELVERCARETREEAMEAVVGFLGSDPLAQLRLPENFDRGAVITFCVDGVFPIDLRPVQEFWAAENDPALHGARRMQCIVCGEERPVLKRLQAKIKGVPGGQTAGTALISANAEAFESYGLSASLVAPTCASCGERFTRAANALLSDGASRFIVGGVAFIFWTREATSFSLRDFLASPKPEDVRELLRSVGRGRGAGAVDDNAFYATALSGSGGRAVVRDWLDTTVGEAKRQIARWFRRQEIVGPWGDEPRPHGLFALAVATVRESKDLAPTTTRALLRGALTGKPLPMGLVYEAVRRNRAERKVTWQRAALMKLVLLSQGYGDEEGTMVMLDHDSAVPAYRCGRLLAVLEQTQQLAVPGVKATIVDRFFGTASSAPASVFGRLIRGAQPHLGKLMRDRPGAYWALQRRLEEIQGGMAGFPRTLTLQEQGLFALGYYHQRAFDRASAMEAAARRKAGVATADAEADLLVEDDDGNNDPRQAGDEE